MQKHTTISQHARQDFSIDNSLTAIGAHERPLLTNSLVTGNFNDFCPLLVFDS
jgi:hypothetical protein